MRTEYNVQYWLYAMLNKQFGRNVVMKRDELRYMYDVHKHAFYVSADNKVAEDLKTWLSDQLRRSYTETKDGAFRKVENNKTFYISIREKKGFVGKPTLYVILNGYNNTNVKVFGE